MKRNNITKKQRSNFVSLLFALSSLLFVSCEQVEDFSQETDGDAVKVVASINKMQTRVAYEDDGTTNFINGDQIRVVNTMRTSKNSATYTYTNNGTYNEPNMAWTTTDALVWNGGTAESQFQAWYPVTASFDNFTLPTLQNDNERLATADWMTASTSAMVKPDDKTINLEFKHKLAKITVQITEFTSQFGEDAHLFPTTTIYSLMDDNVTVNGGIKPIVRSNSATAIVCPGKYAPGSKLMEITISEPTGETYLDVPVNAFLTDTGLEAGKHYTFNLTVGKNAAVINRVSVTDWIEKEIDGGMAEEVIPNTFDATAMTAEQLNAAVTKALEYGHTEISVTLAADADATMFSAITTALAAANIADGSINLTISGVKTVPEYGFFDFDDYSDNDDKNIAGDKLKSLTLTDVETIGEYAFSACTYLESVNLPQVVTIGECAFNEWKKGTKLTSLNLPNATTIGDWAFAYSSLLTSINLPKVTSIGVLAFGFCDISTLDLPEVTTVSGEAFLDNYNLVSCSAPKATTIGYYPWGNCSKFETLTLTAAGGFTLGNNLFAYTPTGQINLVLNKDKESQVTQNGDGTVTWKTTNSYGGKLEYTFKSITFVGE